MSAGVGVLVLKVSSQNTLLSSKKMGMLCKAAKETVAGVYDT